MHRKRPKRPIITKNYALQGFQLVIPEMFSNFVKVSFYKHSTNISNDMTKKLILAAAMLLTGSAAVAAQPKVISHRGYWTAPNSAQNSLASFTKADSVGVFGSEIDVWLTADDKLIVNHDRVYKGTDINMEKSTLKEITSIVLPNGENIPTLDAYLRLVAGKPNTRLILEMKSLSDLKREDLAAEKIVKALRKYNLLDRTDIIAFSINACLAFKKLLPDGRIFYLNGDLAPRSIKKLGLTGIDYSMSVLRKNPKWVEQAHKEGLEVNVWTVDTEEDMRYFIDLGVDYITTDYPERLQALLK
jgi:glycerophosphodiester phosphodiesterase